MAVTVLVRKSSTVAISPPIAHLCPHKNPPEWWVLVLGLDTKPIVRYHVTHPDLMPELDPTQL